MPEFESVVMMRLRKTPSAMDLAPHATSVRPPPLVGISYCEGCRPSSCAMVAMTVQGSLSASRCQPDFRLPLCIEIPGAAVINLDSWQSCVIGPIVRASRHWRVVDDMMVSVHTRGRTFAVDVAHPIDLSLPVSPYTPKESQRNAFHCELASAHLQCDTRLGGSVNAVVCSFAPHGNGTHTECVGHLSVDVSVWYIHAIISCVCVSYLTWHVCDDDRGSPLTTLCEGNHSSCQHW